MIIGSLVLVLGTMLTSISTQYYQYILAQGILIGVGIGTVYVASFVQLLELELISSFPASTRVWPRYRPTFANTGVLH